MFSFSVMLLRVRDGWYVVVLRLAIDGGSILYSSTLTLFDIAPPGVILQT